MPLPNETRSYVRSKITFNERETDLGPNAPDVNHTLEWEMVRRKWDEGPDRLKRQMDVEKSVQMELDEVPTWPWQLALVYGQNWTTNVLARMRVLAREDKSSEKPYLGRPKPIRTMNQKGTKP